MAKRKVVLLSVAIPFLFLPAFFTTAVEYLGSLIAPQSYTQEVITQEGIQEPETVSLGYWEISAYNPVRSQTDGDPCAGALAGIDFCTTDKKIVAVRHPEVPLGSIIIMNGEEYLVGDRFAPEYDGKKKIDILMNVPNSPDYVDTIQKAVTEAKKFGIQKHEVFLVVAE